MPQRLQVLTISDLFPTPVRPAFGIFVDRQTHYLTPYVDNVVVAPVRVFPPLRTWRDAWRLRGPQTAFHRWRTDLEAIPQRATVGGVPVFYPRYNSPPRQLCHGFWGFFAYAYLRRLLATLHREHQFDLIHAHYASPAGVIALLARRWMHAPVVLSVHGGDVTFTARRDPLNRAVVRWAFGQADMVLANSTWIARQIARYGGNPKRTRIVRLGSSPPSQFDSAPRSPSDPVALLSVGYLVEPKGQAYVLPALRRLLDEGYHLCYEIVGDGPDEARLRGLVQSLGLQAAVSFAGYKAPSDVWAYYAGCDIFVLPSAEEPFGLVYIEALSCGKPAIGCEGSGGPEDLRALGDCIECVRPRSADAVYDALKRLLDDPERARRMGQTGRAIVAKYYTWEGTAEQTMEAYREALENRLGQAAHG